MMERCARTIAAVEGRTKVLPADIQEAATLVLPHRIRQNQPPPSAPPPPMKAPKDDGPTSENNEPAGEETTSNSTSAESDFSDNGKTPPEASNFLEERIFDIGQTFNVRRIEVRKDRISRRGSGRRSHTRSGNKSGRYVKNRMAEDYEDIALDATLRAAAPYQIQRSNSKLAVDIHRTDVRKKIRQRRISNFIVFAVDASGSMGAKKRMISTKGAIMSLLLDAYRMRDRIAMVAFRKSDAEILLPPTNSVSVASRLLQTLPTGGRTPLSAGLVKAFELARTRLYKDPFLRPILIFITDGRGNVPLNRDTKPASEAFSIAAKMATENRINCIVVDTEGGGFMKFGLAGSLARHLKAKHYRIENLRANDLVRMVKEVKHA
jgi:magnesium chelatase subunit D